MHILVFLQGTITAHQTSAGKSRAEMISQVKDQEPSVRDYWHYVPIGNAAGKLRSWVSHGAQISYIGALTEDKRVRGDEIVGSKGLEADRAVLERYDFPGGFVYHRNVGEGYKDVIERIDPLPDVLIEDDAESIGGMSEMVYPELSPATQQIIHSVVVKEFEGIDHLPDDPCKLTTL